jgi:hypothetical protein
MTITLPPLDQPCPHCAGPQADAERAANRQAWRQWNTEEQGRYSEFAANFDRAKNCGGAWDAFQRTDTYRDLLDRRPEDLPDVGCEECDYTGLVPTDAGEQVLAFVRRHTA